MAIPEKLAALGFEERYVAFLDILGFAKIVESFDKDPERAEALLVALQQVRDSKVGRSATLTAFSDSIIISVPANKPTSSFDILTTCVYFIQMLAERNIFLRGGISAGPMIHREGLLLGSGFVRAYRLESQLAHTPRILIDDKIIRSGASDRTLAEVMMKSIWQIDTDGSYYVHPFNFLVLHDEPSWLPTSKWREHARGHIEKALRDYRDDANTLAKYRWLANRFNEALRKDDTLKPIPLSLPELSSEKG